MSLNRRQNLTYELDMFDKKKNSNFAIERKMSTGDDINNHISHLTNFLSKWDGKRLDRGSPLLLPILFASVTLTIEYF